MGIQKNVIFYIIAILLLIIDQITKWIVSTNMYLGQALPEEGFLRLVYVLNTGSAFGLFQGWTDILIVFSFVGIALVLYLLLKSENQPFFYKLGLSMILSGAFGNLIDRLVNGAVVDFISVGWWPVFNIADSSISVGMFVLAFSILFLNKQNSD
ncbi:MAG: signal peptidase II [Dehalococcoidia bacterium]